MSDAAHGRGFFPLPKPSVQSWQLLGVVRNLALDFDEMQILAAKHLSYEKFVEFNTRAGLLINEHCRRLDAHTESLRSALEEARATLMDRLWRNKNAPEDAVPINDVARDYKHRCLRAREEHNRMVANAMGAHIVAMQRLFSAVALEETTDAHTESRVSQEVWEDTHALRGVPTPRSRPFPRPS